MQNIAQRCATCMSTFIRMAEWVHHIRDSTAISCGGMAWTKWMALVKYLADFITYRNVKMIKTNKNTDRRIESILLTTWSQSEEEALYVYNQCKIQNFTGFMDQPWKKSNQEKIAPNFIPNVTSSVYIITLWPVTFLTFWDERKPFTVYIFLILV